MKTIAVYSKEMGGIAGKSKVFPDVLGTIDKSLRKNKGECYSDFVVTHIGNRVICMIVYDQKDENEVANAVWEAFSRGLKVSTERKLFMSSTRTSFVSINVDKREAEEFVLFLAGTDDVHFWDFLHIPDDQAAKGVSVLICRTEGIYCSTPEILELFADKECNARGICPVSLCDATIVRTKVIPVVALGFSLGDDGKLTGPLDLFDTPQFDAPRFRASEC